MQLVAVTHTKGTSELHTFGRVFGTLMRLCQGNKGGKSFLPLHADQVYSVLAVGV